MKHVSLIYIICWITESSLGRDTRSNQAQKVQSWMAILAFKTCKVWFSLNPSMCNSGLYRISGSSICFFPNIFSSLLISFLIILFLENFFFLVFLSFFSRCLLHNPSSPFIVEFSGRPGEPLVPLFWSFANRVCSVLIISVSPLFRFLSFFPSLGSDSFESFWLAILFGACWGMPFSASSLLVSFTFPFLSYLGGILFCSFEIVLLSFFFLVLVPRRLFCLCHEGSLAFFCFFLVFFLSICPGLLFLRAYWWCPRILASYTLLWCSLFFLLWSLFPFLGFGILRAFCIILLDLVFFFLLGLARSFLGLAYSFLGLFLL